MDIIYSHSRLGVLITSSWQTNITPLEREQHKAELNRWRPYRKDGFALRKQTGAHHLAAAKNEVAWMLYDAMQNSVCFDRMKVQDKVCKYPFADTSNFDGYDSDSSIDDLIFEAIERLTVLCYAFEQYRKLVQTDYKKAPQILVDTLNLEVPYLNQLSTQLPAFGKEFWDSEISKACGEFIADFADEFPHLYLSEQAAQKSGIKVLEPRQLQISPALTQ